MATGVRDDRWRRRKGCQAAASHRSVSQGIGPVSLLGFSTVNLGSRASYKHGSRDLLPTDLVMTHPIKTLRGV
jgi:hypothetical protein